MGALDEHNLLSDKHNAFRKWHSFETQLTTEMNNWTKLLANKCKAYTIILDFENAFETPSHELLKSTLFSYGICGKTLQWMNAVCCSKK